MTITFWSVTWWQKQPDGSFGTHTKSGLTSDEWIVNQVIFIKEKHYLDERNTRLWGASKDSDGQSTADSVDALKKLIKDKAGDEAEETATGYWTTPDCKWRVS